MKIRSVLSMSLLGMILSSFSVIAQQPTSAPSDSASTVFVYRLRDGYGALLKPSVFCDGKPIVRMRNGRFAKLSIPAGRHNFTSNFEGNGAILDLKPGDTYYIRVEMSRATLMHAARGKVTVAAEGQGRFEVDALKPAEDEDLK